MIEAGELRIDVPRRTVEVRGDEVAAHVRRVRAPADARLGSRAACSPPDAARALWGGADYREPRTIDVHVRHLREKIEQTRTSRS